MIQKLLYTFPNIWVVNGSKEMWLVYNPTIITELKIAIREELAQITPWLEWFDYEFV